MALIDCLQLNDVFYSREHAEQLYRRFIADHRWPSNTYSYAGRHFTLPRLQTWHADPGIVYSYSNNLLKTQPWSTLLKNIKQRVEEASGYRFNAVLVNYYRNGEDYVGWHADNEAELGGQPYIASVSLGTSRLLRYRHKISAEEGQVLLNHGSLLLMKPEFQKNWLHSVPPDKSIPTGRINLTFRWVLPRQQRLPPLDISQSQRQ